jgi:hypothetical protein
LKLCNFYNLIFFSETELLQFKETNKVALMFRELEYERERNKQLFEQLQLQQQTKQPLVDVVAFCKTFHETVVRAS